MPLSDIRRIDDKDFDDYMRINCEAYPGMEIFTAEERAKYVTNMRQSKGDPRTVRFGAFRDDTMVGCMRLFDYVMNVRGAKVKTGGVGAVAVDLMHKKTHVAKEMMVYYLNHYIERDFPMAILWPFRSDFYHDMGFGLGARMFRYSIKPSSLPRGTTKDHVRYLDQKDMPALTECHNRYVDKRSGMVEQTDLGWEVVFRQYKKTRFVGVEIDGRLEGYLSYTFKKTAPDSFLVNDLIVDCMIYHTPEALAEMLTFLRSQLDQIRRIVLHTDEDEFYYLLRDPRNESTGIINPTHQESHVAGVGLMYRIFNTRLLFEQMGPGAFADVDLKLKITVRDSFLKSNAGSLTVSFEAGQATVVDGGEFDAEIELDVAEFSSMILGAAGFRSLCTYGLATISRPELIDSVDRLFATSEPPLTLMSF
ncbi:MAG: GNAT family N-acetyltransferase [bacterium]|nr:GNAT family N-acetyltransferase [bacterium]